MIGKDLVLSDGIHIPARTITGVPSHAITHDPALYPDPGRFDGFRFIPSEALNKPLSDGSGPPPSTSTLHTPPTFTTTNAANLSWGFGKHACSGRFFASSEIKMVMAHLLLNYDFKFEDPNAQRPKNISFELQNSPDLGVKVLLRRRHPAVQVLEKWLAEQI